MKAKKDVFKKVLKLAADKNPAVDFTASVMQTIEADIKQETALKTMLKKEEAVGPSFSFTANVMAGIKASKPQYVYKPIITQKVWYGIAALLLAFIVIVGLTNSAGNHADQSRMSFIIDQISRLPIMYLMALVVAVLLLIADYFINRQKSTQRV
jgi:hypothetical protein